MKIRLTKLICLVILMTMVSVPAIAADMTPKVFIDGQVVTFDVAPIIDNGRTMVPLRAIFEKMGATVTWNDANKSATAVKGDTTVVVIIDSISPTINGEVKTIDVPAKIVDGRTLAPMRFVCEAFGSTVDWDPVTLTINMKSNTVSVTPPADTSEKIVDSVQVEENIIDGLFQRNNYGLTSMDALVILTASDADEFEKFMDLSNADKTDFLNTYIQESWGDVLGCSKVYVRLDYNGNVYAYINTSYQAESKDLELALFESGITDTQFRILIKS